MTAPLRLSYSAVSEYMLCPRRSYYRSAGYQPVGREGRATAFGSAFHAGQQVWWAGRYDDDQAVRLEAAREAFSLDAQVRGLGLEDQILGNILLTGYAVQYQDLGLMFHTTPVVEEKVVAPVLDPRGNPDPDMEVVAVFDVVAYDEEGRTVLMDHKTTTSHLDDGSAYWTRVDNSLQVSLYYIIASDLGRTAGRFVWDAVRAPELALKLATPPEKREFYVRGGKYGKPGEPKPGTRLADESPEEFATYVTDTVLSNPGAFYARRDVGRTEAALEAARADLWTVGRSMLHAREEGLYPRNPQSCNAFNRPCPYAPVCWAGESIDNPRLYTLRTRSPFEK